MKAARLLLFPFALIYAIGVAIRNTCYNVGIFKSTSFDKPVINVGNLSLGGTGKTPHIEYLIRLLDDSSVKLATLSRGYGRSTTGYLVANESHNVSDIGDEPLQYFSKFKSISVAVDNNRPNGCRNLFESGVDIVLLDDAFQHRAIMPSFNILLTDFNDLFSEDRLLPIGNLREYRSGSTRADAIVVTKCPTVLSPIDRRRIGIELRVLPRQPIFFSHIQYQELIPINALAQAREILPEELQGQSVVLVTGIANALPMKDFLENEGALVQHFEFKDHHQFDGSDVKKIKDASTLNPNSIVVTTEKDAMRLKYPTIQSELSTVPLYYIPIQIGFNEVDTKEFNALIKNHV